MKFAIFSLLLAAAFLLGCADTAVSPAKPENESYQLIKLPPKSGLSVETIFSTSQSIDGTVGGSITLSKSYQSVNGQLVTLNALLNVPKNAFEGIVTISMVIDDEYAAIEFDPGMAFNKHLDLNLEFSGLDLLGMGLENGKQDFVFIDDNGNIEQISNNGIQVDISTGTISVTNAKLYHFSRYAFTR